MNYYKVWQGCKHFSYLGLGHSGANKVSVQIILPGMLSSIFKNKVMKFKIIILVGLIVSVIAISRILKHKMFSGEIKKISVPIEDSVNKDITSNEESVVVAQQQGGRVITEVGPATDTTTLSNPTQPIQSVAPPPSAPAAMPASAIPEIVPSK